MKHAQKATSEIIRYSKAEPSLYTTDENARLLRRHSVTHHRLCEYECNGANREKYPHESWEQYDKAREKQMLFVEKKKEAIEKLITKYAFNLGLKVRFEGDPRGCTVRLFTAKDWETMQPVWAQHLENSSYGHGVNVW